jgi:hypothetical protein
MSLQSAKFGADLSMKGELSVSATNIFWGQVITVFAIVLLAIWTATEWTAWRLGFQPELGRHLLLLAGYCIFRNHVQAGQRRRDQIGGIRFSD